MKVTVMARIHLCGNQPFVKPVWQGTRLKAGVVLIDRVETKRDDISYYLRYTRAGKQITEPAGTDPNDVLTFQKRILATLQAEANGLSVSGGKIVPMPEKAPEAARTTIQQAVANYLTKIADDPDLKRHTVTGYSHTLGQWLSWLKKRYLDEITRDDVWGFRTYIWKTAKQPNGKPYTERTANNKTENVASFLNAVGHPKVLTDKDWQTMKPGPSKKVPYSKAEFKAMRAACETEEDRDVLEFFVGTGFRKGEAGNIKWAEIDFTNSYARLGHDTFVTKDKEPRNIQLGPALLARLKARRLRSPDDVYVFPNRDGGPNNHLDRVIERIVKKAGVSKVGKSICHSLRKTYATRLKNDAKTEIYKIMKLLGHSDIKTTEDYLGGYDPDSETVGADIERALA